VQKSCKPFPPHGDDGGGDEVVVRLEHCIYILMRCDYGYCESEQRRSQALGR